MYVFAIQTIYEHILAFSYPSLSPPHRSFGVSLWEVGSFAQWPYDDLSNEEVIQMVISTGKCLLENPFKTTDPIAYM